MKIFLTNQKNKLNHHLDILKKSEVRPYNKNNLIEKITSITIDTNKSINKLDLNFFLNYNIFPESILTFKTQWEDENRLMRIGDTIVQQAFLPPIKLLSQKIIFGVRICNIVIEDNKVGFSYETLEGHIEKGISTFTIEQNENKVNFTIHTFSSPGNLLTRLVGPIISIPYQTYCTKSALRNVKSQIEFQ